MDASLKLGKSAARKDAISLKFAAYAQQLATPPISAGHANIVTADWGMLGNDQFGDCVWAGAAHETILWNKEAQQDIAFSTDETLKDYSAVTGFDPNDPSTDNGTDMEVAAKYRRKSGVRDASGTRHKIAAYLAIENITQLKQAIWLFSAVGIGIQFPTSAMKQFKAGKKWTVTKSQIEGGHYIPGVSYDAKTITVITWGKPQIATWQFIEKYMDEAVVYLSTEMLTGGKSIDGFDLTTLQADLAAL